MIAELGFWTWGSRQTLSRTMLSMDDPVSHEPRSGYDRELVERVWETAQIIPGNDPAIWRKDERGAWMNRLAYRDRRSEFGWEIADSSFTLRAFGIAALRPLQWQNYVDHLAASSSSVITSDGLRNTRRLL